MFIEYESWNPRADSVALVEQANEIIEEYRAEDLTLTLRQLYYQFVARDLIENTERSYKNLGNVITKARMAGMISWTAIEDRAREFNEPWVEENADKLVRDLQWYIRFDQWQRQESYVEVWVEKEALGNIVESACDPFLVPHMSCKGYLSASEAWRAGRRFREATKAGKECHLIHLGDHDPSGIDMTRDNGERVGMFSDYPWTLKVHRIALNMDQVDQYSPPPNPAKITDTRAKDYIAKYGNTSWELDALEPQVLKELIQEKVKSFIDFSAWEEVNQTQENMRSILAELGDNWEKVQEFIKSIRND